MMYPDQTPHPWLHLRGPVRQRQWFICSRCNTRWSGRKALLFRSRRGRSIWDWDARDRRQRAVRIGGTVASIPWNLVMTTRKIGRQAGGAG